MGVRNLPDIASELIRNGRPPETPAAVVESGTLPQQRTVVAELKDIAQAAADADVHPPAILVVGQTVSLRQSINWFEELPMFGRTIFVTRALSQAAGLVKALRSLGARAVEFPTIRIEAPLQSEPLAEAVRKVHQFDWIVFTSANGVESFFGCLKALGKDARCLAGARVASVGPATSEALGRFGIAADFVPSRFLSRAIAEELATSYELKGKAILLARAASGDPDLARELIRSGAQVTEVETYRTVTDTSDKSQDIEQLLKGNVDLVTFTSPSTVRSFLEIVGPERFAAAHVKTEFASIGPVTSAAMQQVGLRVAVEANKHDADGLLAAIVEHYRRSPGQE
jgi:uroporphyrinogen III methyltransferase/synthase